MTRLVVVALLLGAAAAPAPAQAAGPPPAVSAAPRETVNGAVFDAAWRAVESLYVDPRFGGVDWAAARAEFRPRAVAARDQAELYRVLAAMVERLHDRHAFVTPPGELARLRAQGDVGAGERKTARLGPGVELVGFKGFDQASTAWALDRIARVPAGSALVLDLRGNRGGDAGRMGRVLGCFLPAGTALAQATDRAGRVRAWNVLPGCAARARPARLVVLVDRDTISSAEIAAAALKREAGATIVGERTGGAVRGAGGVRLPDGGLLVLSELEVTLPDGRRLEGTGVAPDLAAVTSPADRAAGRDPALDAAAKAAAGR
jgi:C-terminal processing protease CtpA/Prc